jgi:hypothetical protein
MILSAVKFATAVALVLLWTATAVAQEENTFAAGVSVTRRFSPDPAAQADNSIGVKLRIRHGETGFGWHYGLGWYSTNLDRTIDGRTVRFGELKVRPFFGGYGYTRRVSPRLLVTADVLGGLASSSIELTAEAEAALQEKTGGVRVATQWMPVLKPEISAWYDLTKRFGISVDFGYVLARPRLTIETSSRFEAGDIRADAFTIGTGLVYRIF